jgi:hypothetical protein
MEMTARNLALGWVAIVGLAGAKPASAPPSGTGREGTPIEREFHIAPPVEPRWTEGVPARPKPRDWREIQPVLRLALPWLAVALD